MKVINILFIAVTLTIAFKAQAERMQRRSNHQQGRISGGINSGSLTRHEARKLNAGQDRIERMEDRAMLDETLSSKEKLKIEKAQDRQSRKIYKQKHDLQIRNKAAAGLHQPAESTAQDSNFENKEK